MSETKPVEIECLIEAYPYLEEKAIIDFINGFTVMSDHLTEKRKLAQKGPAVRMLNYLNGKSEQRQQLIDSKMEASLAFLIEYVSKNENRLAKNECFLAQVMDGVSLLSEKIQEVTGDTGTLRQDLSELTNRVDSMEHSLSQRMGYSERHISAINEMNLALSTFSIKEALFLPEQSLWMLLTHLKHGEFGAWMESDSGNPQHEQNVQMAIQTLKNKCLRILCENTGRSTHQLVDRKTLFSQLAAKNELLQDALCLVSEHESGLLEPVILALNSGEEPVLNNELPYVFSNASIYDELSQLLTSRGVL